VDRPTSSGVSITVERAHEMSSRLGVRVTIDETGWVKHGVVLRYQRGPHGTIQPEGVLVGPEALVEDVLEHEDLVERSARYNEALKCVRQLQKRLDALIERGLTLPPGSATMASFKALLWLDSVIATRQSGRMGYGFVSPEILQNEIAFFEKLHAEHEPVVLLAERSLPGTQRQ
jgi:hypothetical protein